MDISDRYTVRRKCVGKEIISKFVHEDPSMKFIDVGESEGV